jgi:hypothetical protein
MADRLDDGRGWVWPMAIKGVAISDEGLGSGRVTQQNVRQTTPGRMCALFITYLTSTFTSDSMPLRASRKVTFQVPTGSLSAVRKRTVPVADAMSSLPPYHGMFFPSGPVTVTLATDLRSAVP